MEPLPFSGTVYIHIGQHKTGTTAIQKFLSENREALLRQKVLYPDAGRSNGKTQFPMHHPLAIAARSAKLSELQKVAYDLKYEIKEADIESVIISSEVFTRPKTDSHTFHIVQNIFANARRKWIVYLRRQDDYLLSRYQEDIKSGNSSWPENISTFAKRMQLNHLEFIRNMEKQLITDDLICVLFDKEKNQLIQSILKIFKVEIKGDMAMPGRVNEKLPWRTVAALRYANVLPDGLARRARRNVYRGMRLMERAGLERWLEGPEPLVEEDRRKLMATYEAANLEMCRRYFEEEDMRYFL